MKVGRGYEGKVVMLTWIDPCEGERQLIEKAPTGLKALAKWIEYGKIDSVEEGVVRMRHSEAHSAGEAAPDEACFGWIVESLITDIVVLEPVKED